MNSSKKRQKSIKKIENTNTHTHTHTSKCFSLMHFYYVDASEQVFIHLTELAIITSFFRKANPELLAKWTQKLKKEKNNTNYTIRCDTHKT